MFTNRWRVRHLNRALQFLPLLAGGVIGNSFASEQTVPLPISVRKIVKEVDRIFNLRYVTPTAVALLLTDPEDFQHQNLLDLFAKTDFVLLNEYRNEEMEDFIDFVELGKFIKYYRRNEINELRNQARKNAFKFESLEKKFGINNLDPLLLALKDLIDAEMNNVNCIVNLRNLSTMVANLAFKINGGSRNMDISLLQSRFILLSEKIGSLLKNIESSKDLEKHHLIHSANLNQIKEYVLNAISEIDTFLRLADVLPIHIKAAIDEFKECKYMLSTSVAELETLIDHLQSCADDERKNFRRKRISKLISVYKQLDFQIPARSNAFLNTKIEEALEADDKTVAAELRAELNSNLIPRFFDDKSIIQLVHFIIQLNEYGECKEWLLKKMERHEGEMYVDNTLEIIPLFNAIEASPLSFETMISDLLSVITKQLESLSTNNALAPPVNPISLKQVIILLDEKIAVLQHKIRESIKQLPLFESFFNLVPGKSSLGKYVYADVLKKYFFSIIEALIADKPQAIPSYTAAIKGIRWDIIVELLCQKSGYYQSLEYIFDIKNLEGCIRDFLEYRPLTSDSLKCIFNPNFRDYFQLAGGFERFINFDLLAKALTNLQEGKNASLAPALNITRLDAFLASNLRNLHDPSIPEEVQLRTLYELNDQTFNSQEYLRLHYGIPFLAVPLLLWLGGHLICHSCMEFIEPQSFYTAGPLLVTATISFFFAMEILADPSKVALKIPAINTLFNHSRRGLKNLVEKLLRVREVVDYLPLTVTIKNNISQNKLSRCAIDTFKRIATAISTRSSLDNTKINELKSIMLTTLLYKQIMKVHSFFRSVTKVGEIRSYLPDNHPLKEFFDPLLNLMNDEHLRLLQNPYSLLDLFKDPLAFTRNHNYEHFIYGLNTVDPLNAERRMEYIALMLNSRKVGSSLGYYENYEAFAKELSDDLLNTLPSTNLLLVALYNPRILLLSTSFIKKASHALTAQAQQVKTDETIFDLLLKSINTSDDLYRIEERKGPQISASSLFLLLGLFVLYVEGFITIG